MTHRFRGGYLSAPRWAKHGRRGRIDGDIVGIYPPEQLKTMKPNEIAELIRRDIYENAFETQRTQPIAYRGRALAEHIERAMYLCPRCGKGGGLESHGNDFSCACGMKARYTVHGFFEGDIPFDNILDWDRWQAEQMLAWVNTAGEECLASDEGIVLQRVCDDATLSNRSVGTLRVYRDRFELGERVFPFDSVTGIGLSGPQSIELACGEEHWFITCPRVCNLRKYVTLYRAAAAPEEILAV